MNLSFESKNKLFKFIYKITEHIFVYEAFSDSIVFFFEDGERIDFNRKEIIAFVQIHNKLSEMFKNQDIWSLEEIKKAIFE